jgi:hypothetical protein
MRAAAGAVLGLLAVAALADDAPRVKATASKTEVTVGEPFTVEVAAQGPPGATFTFPAEAGNEDVVLQTAPADSGAEPAPAARHRYEALVYAIGEARVPPIPVKYRLDDGSEGEVVTEPIPLRVVSLLSKDPAEQKLADIRGPGSLAIGREFWIAVAIGLAAAAGTAFALWRRFRPRPEAALAPVEVAPDAEALRALDSLAASRRVERGEFRGFYIALVEIAKRYLERRLGAPVLEMTSAEMLAFLRDGQHGELLPAARDLALAADQIKFARGHGVAAEAQRHLESVRGLVRALEARLRPKEERAA